MERGCRLRRVPLGHARSPAGEGLALAAHALDNPRRCGSPWRDGQTADVRAARRREGASTKMSTKLKLLAAFLAAVVLVIAVLTYRVLSTFDERLAEEAIPGIAAVH